MEAQFIVACKNGNLEKAKKMIEDNPTLNIRAKSYQAFRGACWYGHLHIAKWLIDLSKDTETFGGPIDIHAEYDHVFRWACFNGYLDIARWLVSLSGIDLSKDIHACSDDAFLSACGNGYLDIARWLIPFGGMPAMALKKHHPIRKFYLNRFPAIGLLSLHFRRYIRDFRERMYSPGGRGYVFAKKRFKTHSEHLGVSESPAQSCR